MQKLFRKFRHMQHSMHDYKPKSSFKKIAIIALVAILVFVIGAIVLVSMLIGWLFNNGSQHVQGATQQVAETVQSAAAPLNLQSYVQNGQVDTAKLEQAFAAIPSPLQGLWLDQLNAQINELKNQAGITDETTRTLQALYDSFKQITQQ
jgi:hypothetical protein